MLRRALPPGEPSATPLVPPWGLAAAADSSHSDVTRGGLSGTEHGAVCLALSRHVVCNCQKVCNSQYVMAMNLCTQRAAVCCNSIMSLRSLPEGGCLVGIT